jgi:hypothetical protein
MSTHHAGPVCGPRRPAPAPVLVPDIDDFIRTCFTDAHGAPIEQAAIHTQLQAFLDAHPKALVELPRDHGKSFQVCCRVLWELAKNPGLRVKIICATDAVAAERSRFLRDTITLNARVRKMFPQLAPPNRGPRKRSRSSARRRPSGRASRRSASARAVPARAPICSSATTSLTCAHFTAARTASASRITSPTI